MQTRRPDEQRGERDSSDELARIARQLANIAAQTALPDDVRAQLHDISEKLNAARPHVSPAWNEDLFSQMAEHLPVGILIVEMPSQELYCNQTALDILGLTKENLHGTTAFADVWDTWETTNADGVIITRHNGLHPTIQAIETRQPVRNFVMGIYRPHLENRIWVQLNVEPILDDTGSIVRVIAGFLDITERKQREDALRISEAKNRALINAIPDMMIRYRRDGTYLEVKPAIDFPPLLPAEQLVGKTVFDVLPAEFAAAQMQRFQYVLDTGEILKYEYELEREGKPSQFEAQMIAYDKDEVLLITRDITEHKRLARALQASNERYDRAIAAAAAGIWDWDIHLDHIYIAPSLMDLLGFHDKQSISSIINWIEQIHPDDQDRVLAALQAHIDGQTPLYEIEYRAMQPDSTVRWVLTRGVVMRDEDGAPHSVIGTAFDITTLKQAEEALRQSEARNRALIEAIPDMIIVLNRQGHFVDVKAPFNFLANSYPSELIGKTVQEILDPHLAERTIDAIDTVLRTGKLRQGEYFTEFQGERRYFETRTIPYGDNLALVIMRDVTESKLLEQDRMDKERLQLLQAFINDVSHDLRTPVTSLMTSTYLLHKFTSKVVQSGVRLNSLLVPLNLPEANLLLAELSDTAVKIEERATTLDESVRRLHNLIESMIEMVKLEGERHYDFRLEDLNLLTNRIVNVMNPLAAVKPVMLVFEREDRIVPAYVDEMSFSRVIQNLIENAIHYTPEGGEIHVRAYNTENAGILEIRDTGIGIAPADLPLIFDRFYRVDKARSGDSGGMGLGLAIVKTIVEAHKGRIEVESQLGKGTMFRVIIPN